MTSSKWKHFPRYWLWGESIGHRWIPLRMSSDAELWRFLWSTPEQTVKETIETWFDTPLRSLWRHCTVLILLEENLPVTSRFPSRRASNSENVSVSWHHFRVFRWRHNGCDGVSNHQPHDCLLNSLFGRRSKKTLKFRVTGLYVGNSPRTGEFPAQMANNAENVSIWWRHHGQGVIHRIQELPMWTSDDFRTVLRPVDV